MEPKNRDFATLSNLLSVIEGFLSILDESEKQHSREVQKYSVVIGRRMGLSNEDMIMLEAAALAHDLGKSIFSRFTSMPRNLSSYEMSLVRRHPESTFIILSKSQDLLLSRVGALAVTHHERWDGGGYPRGLIHEKIPLIGRIVALADCWSALISKRPYRPPFNAKEAESIIFTEKGQQFDPALVDIFYKIRQDGEFH